VTIAGHAATISAGEWLTASGEWINDHTHGQQFKARFLRTSAPSSIEGIEKYLASGMIRGIGPVYAKRMVKAFGDKVFDITEAEPDRMREIDGIGPVRARRITSAWVEQKIVRESMVLLHSHGVVTARGNRGSGNAGKPTRTRAIRIESGDLQPSGAIVGRVDRRVERYTVWIDLPDLIAGDTTAKEGNQ
jgi:NAD-dependent DNA ligase